MTFYKSHLDLEQKKDKMFPQGFNAGWMIDFSRYPKVEKNSIIQNDKVAKMLMLPEVGPFVILTFSKPEKSRKCEICLGTSTSSSRERHTIICDKTRFGSREASQTSRTGISRSATNR